MPCNLQPVTGLSLPMPDEYLSLCTSPVLLSVLFALCRTYFLMSVWLLFTGSDKSCPGMTAVELKSMFPLIGAQIGWFAVTCVWTNIFLAYLTVQ